MKRKIIFAIIFFIVTANISFCQNDFRKGFIITLENDTINGQVNYQSNARNYKSCIFKIEQVEREYYPGEIIGFGYDNDKFFSSQIIENTFVEVLVLGEMSLYRSIDKFHIKKDTTLYDLESLNKELEINGEVHKMDDYKWRGILSYIISDCIINANNIVSTVDLDAKSLTKLIVEYNICKGSGYEVFKASKPWVKFDFGATAGLTRTEINFTPPGYYDYTEIAYESHKYLEDSYSSFDPNFGVLFGVSSPRISEKLSFQGEVHYIKSSYSSFAVINRTSISYHDVYINLNTLSVPLSLKYSFLERIIGFYLQGGVNFDYNLNSKATVLSEGVTRNVVNTLPERTAFEINKNQIGYWGGIGIIKSFQKFKASIAIRYYQMSKFDNTKGIAANTNRISINLILFKK